jgi:hypothetical protein
MTVVHIDDNDWGVVLYPGNDDSGADRIFGREGAEEIASTVEMNVYGEFLRGWNSRWTICSHF